MKSLGIKLLMIMCLTLLAPRMAAAQGLSFKIGGVEFTPGGTLDVTGVYRDVGTVSSPGNTGNGPGTNFNGPSFDNFIAGRNSDMRISAQNTRFSLKVNDKFGDNDITGFGEIDFFGNNAPNFNVTSNSISTRMRVGWLDYKRGKWEVTGGQAYSWLTPNRVGLGPDESDVFITKNIDQSLQVGLPWTRAAQIRGAYHFTDGLAAGLALENPDPYVAAGEVIFPFLFNAQLGSQFDAANNPIAPNSFPDIITKIVYDGSFAERSFHVETAGLVRQFHIENFPPGATDFDRHSSIGGGASAGGNVEVIKNFRLVGNFFWNKGGGRYLGGLGPDVVLQPTSDGTQFNLQIREVESKGAVLGGEWQATQKNMLALYFGQAYFWRNSFPDITSPLPNKPDIGFGGRGAPTNTANRIYKEWTLDWIHSFWKEPQHGELQLALQGSYVERQPWFVPVGAPQVARSSMLFTSLRYILP